MDAFAACICWYICVIYLCDVSVCDDGDDDDGGVPLIHPACLMRMRMRLFPLGSSPTASDIEEQAGEREQQTCAEQRERESTLPRSSLDSELSAHCPRAATTSPACHTGHGTVRRAHNCRPKHGGERRGRETNEEGEPQQSSRGARGEEGHCNGRFVQGWYGRDGR